MAKDKPSEPHRWSRERVYLLSRLVVCAVAASSLGSLFLTPQSVWSYTLDVLVRTYLVFVGTVMAHEGSHGLLGRTRRANVWWGRLALLPSMVPYANFGERTYCIIATPTLARRTRTTSSIPDGSGSCLCGLSECHITGSSGCAIEGRSTGPIGSSSLRTTLVLRSSSPSFSVSSVPQGFSGGCFPR